MLTPWGASQFGQFFGPGLAWVSTASHGGLGVPLDLALDLSDYAWGIALEYTRSPSGGYLWFEEDCAFNAVFAERPEWAKLDLAKNLASWKEKQSEYLSTEEQQDRIVSIAARLSLPDDQIAALYAVERDRYSAPKRARLESDGAGAKCDVRRHHSNRVLARCIGFDPAEVGGAFDGTTVTSDADPGL